MQRGFLSFVRLALPVVFACVVLAISITISGAPATTPVRAALHDAFASSDTHVIVVARAGGDFTSVTAALNSITDNSSTNRYLVWVAPGTYTETVKMRKYVDIEGAGERVTKIINTTSANNATVFGASNAELRYLTVETRSAPSAPAIWNDNASPSLLHVTAISSQQGSVSTRKPGDSAPDIVTNQTIRNTNASAPVMADVTVSTTVALNALGYGIYNDASAPTMKNVAISVVGGNISTIAVYNTNSSSLTMDNVTIAAFGGTANCGVYNDNSSFTMKDGMISASSQGICNNGSGNFRATVDDSTISAAYATISNSASYALRVGVSKLAGGPVAGTFVTCAGVYDENYTFYPNTCP
jgi:hypothetical protein